VTWIKRTVFVFKLLIYLDKKFKAIPFKIQHYTKSSVFDSVKHLNAILFSIIFYARTSMLVSCVRKYRSVILTVKTIKTTTTTTTPYNNNSVLSAPILDSTSNNKAMNLVADYNEVKTITKSLYLIKQCMANYHKCQTLLLLAMKAFL